MVSDRVVVAVVPDLMDRSRLGGTSGLEVRFVAAADLTVAVTADEVELIVVDLGRPGGIDAVVALPEGLGVRVVGFGPHVEGDLLQQAMTAGCSEVLPRSKFFSRWPNV